jgi:hypothetical protein
LFRDSERAEERDSMLKRFAPIQIPAAITAIGLMLLIRGLLLPEYLVPNGDQLLFHGSWHEDQSNQWDALREKIVTRHFVYCDLGWGVMALGASIMAILASKRVWTSADFREMTTPRSKGVFYALATITWLSYIPAQVFWINYVDAREDAPFVENMAVPIESTLAGAFGIVGLPVILFGVWVVTQRKPLPLPIWTPFIAPGLATIAIGLALILAVLVTAGGVLAEPPLVPSCICTVYLLICGRAISVSPAEIIPGRGFEVVQRTIPHQ